MFNGKTHYKLSFSIAMLVYQMVSVWLAKNNALRMKSSRSNDTPYLEKSQVVSQNSIAQQVSKYSIHYLYRYSRYIIYISIYSKYSKVQTYPFRPRKLRALHLQLLLDKIANGCDGSFHLRQNTHLLFWTGWPLKSNDLSSSPLWKLPFWSIQFMDKASWQWH